MRQERLRKALFQSIIVHSIAFIVINALLIACCPLMRYFFSGTLYTNIDLPEITAVLYQIVIYFLPLLHTIIFFIVPIIVCFALDNDLWFRINRCFIGIHKTEIEQTTPISKACYLIWLIYIIVFHVLMCAIAYFVLSNVKLEIGGNNVSFVCKIMIIILFALQLYTILRNIFPISNEKQLRKRVCKHCQCVTNVIDDSKKIKDAEYSTSESTYYTTEKVGEIVSTDTGDTIADVYGEVAHDRYGVHKISNEVYEHELKCCVCGHTETICTNSSVLTRKDKKQIEKIFYL